ncbi:MAG TPA: efflux RND transporter periplasmic adaptor subunit [Bryobacteraceae bacterium]|nr:efflux RND transporter periplasmic adaptor subunit [Bryobacteraceae bacterium]
MNRNALLAATLCLVPWFLASCGRGPDSSAPLSVTSTTATGESKAHLFTVPQDQMAHVQVVPVQSGKLSRVLRLTGAVAYNSFETTPVITQIGGPVARILVSPGQEVKVGQPMLYVSSPDYAQLRTNFVKARSAYELALKTYSRADELYARGARALADLEQAKSARDQAQGDLDATDQALKVLGLNPEKVVKEPVSPEIAVFAPIAGVVVERLASPGQVLQAGATQVFTISNMNTVWVLANVYEHDLGSVHMGDAVEIQTDAYATRFHGKISFISPALDATSRTLQVRIVTDNPGGKLKKDMYVTAIVQAGAIENALTVPDAALLRTAENEPFVYVVADPAKPNQFSQRLVSVGESQGGRTQLLSGARQGENVAADGSLFLQFANSFQR